MGVVAGFLVHSARTNNQALSLSTASIGSETVAPLDQLSSSDVALSVARATGLAEAIAVMNQADSVQSLKNVTVDAAVAAKPQVVATSLKSVADIQEYKVQPGDTVGSVAAKFGITSESLRWSNGLSGDRLSAGITLVVPPVSGIIYTVKQGDTPSSLAARYQANEQRIIAFNDAEISGLATGQRIVIPDGKQPAPVVTYSSYAFGVGNGYDPGYCTWHVANRRIAVGKQLPTRLGNAGPWVRNAPMYGLEVGSYNPDSATDRAKVKYAALVTNKSNPGHVVFVEDVYADGSLLISEMNYSGRYSQRTQVYSKERAASFKGAYIY